MVCLQMFLFLSFNLYKNQVVIAFFLLYFCFFSLITNITAEYFECKFYPFPPPPPSSCTFGHLAWCATTAMILIRFH